MTFCFMNLGFWEILIIALVVLLLFGASRIPKLMRSMGQGVKNFKDGMNGIGESSDKERHDTPSKDNEQQPNA